jgi:hypothetical protein
MSKIDGNYTIEIAGKPYTMQFDWQALSEVQAAHGDTPNLFNSEVVASVASFGLARSHPEMTKGRIIELSPPLVPFINSVQKALNWAYFGKDNTPEVAEKKKISQLMGIFFRPLDRLFGKG